jgi:hypothetical protein
LRNSAIDETKSKENQKQNGIIGLLVKYELPEPKGSGVFDIIWLQNPSPALMSGLFKQPTTR